MLYFIRFSFFSYSFFLCLPTVMPVGSSGGDGSAIGPALGAEFLDDDELLNMWPHMDPNFISRLSTPNSWAPLLSHDFSAIDQVAPLSAHSSRVASGAAVLEAGSSSASALDDVRSDAVVVPHVPVPGSLLPVADVLNNLPRGMFPVSMFFYTFLHHICSMVSVSIQLLIYFFFQSQQRLLFLCGGGSEIVTYVCPFVVIGRLFGLDTVPVLQSCLCRPN
jgi:hypothetical protein